MNINQRAAIQRYLAEIRERENGHSGIDDERGAVTAAEAVVWSVIFAAVMALCWIVLGLEF